VSVPWESFCCYPGGGSNIKFSDAWLFVPGNVVSTFRDGDQWCRLCDGYFTGTPARHVASHEPELRAWREGQRSNGKPVGSDVDAKLVKALRLVDQGVTRTGRCDRRAESDWLGRPLRFDTG
jgi:hypothetical protein